MSVPHPMGMRNATIDLSICRDWKKKAVPFSRDGMHIVSGSTAENDNFLSTVQCNAFIRKIAGLCVRSSKQYNSIATRRFISNSDIGLRFKCLELTVIVHYAVNLKLRR